MKTCRGEAQPSLFLQLSVHRLGFGRASLCSFGFGRGSLYTSSSPSRSFSAMAMENSSSLSNDGSKEISSATREDLTSLASGLEQQSGEDATQESKTEGSLLDEKAKDSLDPEGDFVDAEGVADDADMGASNAVGLNFLDSERLSKDTEEEDVGEDENGSVESFDSALERIAAASTGDPASPEDPSSPLFQPAETVQQVALRQLNLLDSGVSSLDTTLLEHVSSAEFGARVTEIAQSQGLSADSEDVEHILSVLLPLVEGEESRAVKDVVDTGSEGAEVADGVEARTQESSSQVESNGDIDTPEILEPHPIDVMQNEDVDDDISIAKNSSTTPDIGDGPSGREDALKCSATNLNSEGISAETQANKADNYEHEPEVIEWDDLNESDVDDLGESNAQPHSAEIDDSEEVVGGEGVDAAGLHKERREMEIPNADNGPKISEDEEKGTATKSEPEGASSTGNAVVDSAEEPKIQYDNGEEARDPEALEAQEPSREEEGSVKLETDEQTKFEHAGTPVYPKEVNEGSSEVAEVPEQWIPTGDSVKVEKVPSGDEKFEGDRGAVLKARVTGEQLPAQVVAGREDFEAEPREFELDESKAEMSEAVVADGSEEVNAKAETSQVSEQGNGESVALGATDVSEGPGIGNVPPAAEVLGTRDNETLDRELSSEKNEPFIKGEESNQESPTIKKTADVSVKGEESVTESASPVAAVVDSKKGEGPEESRIIEKTTDASAEREESGTQNSSPVAAVVDSKASTAPEKDSASSLGGAGPSLPVRPAGLGRSVPFLEHVPRTVQRSSGVPASTRQSPVTNEENQSSTDVSEGGEDAREKLQMIRVKFLRLAHRLGQSAHNVVVAQVLYRLGLAEQLRGGRGTGRTGAFSFERASVLAEEQEAAGADDLEFGCTIMVLGKSGVGKSATINSLFDEVKSGTNAYSPATNKVQEIIGTVHGIKLRVIDTPGLLTSFADQRRNERIMSSVKRFIKKSPPDIVLYFDRLDMQSRDYGDLPLLRIITDTFGSAVWFNAIVVLTHASSAPPDGANGVPVSYEMFVAQRSHVVQQTIRQAAGDMRLMNPVSLVENHAACRRNRAGERVLPNGQVWKPQLLLLCFASKILAEANSLLKLQDNSPAKPFGVRPRVPPLPFLLSSLLQSRAQLKLPDEQIGSDDESEDELEEEADSEGEEEYDDLPPFRRLTKDELKLLDKEQRRIYAEELEYREKLFMRKQLKDERARKKELKRRLAALPKDVAQYSEESLEEENASASVPVPMPDMALPPSFDSDNPTHRYRYLDTTNQWLVRPVLETHGWDHDSGYDGLNVEKMFVVSKKVPVSVSGQVTKDKKEANLQMECAASFKNGEGKVTQTGLDIQTIGKDLAYTLRSETKFDNFKRNKTTCGLAVTLLGETVAAGMKIEDRLLIGKRVKLVFNGGALTGRGDVAYGGSLEATIRDKDYPIGQFLSTFGLSVMDWHGDLAIGGNLQVQCKVGKTMTIVRGNLNNRRAGQVSIRVSSSEQLQMALIGLIPLLRTFINNRILSSN